MKKLLLAIGAGAAAAYAFRSRIAALIGRGDGGASLGNFGDTDAETRAGGPDDVVLTEKVKSEIFRDPDVPKGQINVNTEYGRVVLRGEVESEDMVRQLVERARAVEGVTGVESMLSVSGQGHGQGQGGGDGAGGESREGVY